MNSPEWDALLAEIMGAEISGSSEEDNILDKRNGSAEMPAEPQSGRRAEWSRKKRDIQRFALSQEDLNLSELIGPRHIRLLIEELTRTFTESADKYLTHIKLTAERMLRKGIPNYMWSAWKNARWSVKPSPGFLYTCTYDNQEYSIWIAPDLPAYYRNEEELVIMAEAPAYVQTKLARHIMCYYRELDRRRKRELVTATALLRAHVRTYYDLLKYNPEWWELAYEIKTGKKYKEIE